MERCLMEAPCEAAGSVAAPHAAAEHQDQQEVQPAVAQDQLAKGVTLVWLVSHCGREGGRASSGAVKGAWVKGQAGDG